MTGPVAGTGTSSLRLQLFRLEESEDSLTIGEPVGVLELEHEKVRIGVEDPRLCEQLEDILSSPILLRCPTHPAGFATQSISVFLDDEGFLSALQERLEQPDIRLSFQLDAQAL